MHPDLLQRVVPKDQGFSVEDGYCGAFRFHFWWYGHWTEVTIDDRLPTTNGHLASMYSEKDEYWAALLEKAYAKYEFTSFCRASA